MTRTVSDSSFSVNCERELRAILAGAAKPNADERLALADRIRAMTPKRRQTDSTLLIREDRDR